MNKREIRQVASVVFNDMGDYIAKFHSDEKGTFPASFRLKFEDVPTGYGSYDYEDGTITISLKHKSFGDLLDTLIHEFSHMMLDHVFLEEDIHNAYFYEFMKRFKRYTKY